MSTATIIFLSLGAIGTVLLMVSLVIGDVFEFAEGGGLFSLPAIAGFMGAFGYAGAATAGIADENTAVLGALAGLVVAIPTAWGISALVNALARHTDKTMTANDYVGTSGVLITAVGKNGYGEVSLPVGGQPLKLSARADNELPAGTAVTVVSAPSETLVFVKKNPDPETEEVA